MKLLYALLLLITLQTSANEIELTISGAQQTQMPIAIIILDESNNKLNEVAETIKKNLEFTEQFKPSIIKYSTQLLPKELHKNIKRLGYAGTPLVVCINSTSPKNIEWRLYETMGCSMLKGKKYKKKCPISRIWAHAITDEVWKVLTNNDGFFSSRIAYCKDSKNNKGHTIRKVYIADYDGSHEELIVDVPTICIAPRWYPDTPTISYSEYADTNIRLMSVSINKQRKPLSLFDGINMLAHFSDDSSIMTYCSSRGSGSCQIYLLENGILKRCTNNTGNNTSPFLIDPTHLGFCSDFQTGSPQIYIANIKTGHLQRITHGGYCSSPSHCKKTNKIAYCKMIQGTMQVMMYDCATKTHTQMTKSSGNKHEPCFSPCGTQLLFVHECPSANSRLCNLNLLTNKPKYITSAHDQCSYPHWSPCYQTFPVIT